MKADTSNHLRKNNFSLLENQESCMSFSHSSFKLDVPQFVGTDSLGEFLSKPILQLPSNVTGAKSQNNLLLHGWAGLEVWMYNNGQITSWNNLLQALQLMFALSQFEDPPRCVFKLTQTSLAREYQTQFEMLSSRVVGLSPHASLSYSISRLKPQIRRVLQALDPPPYNGYWIGKATEGQIFWFEKYMQNCFT